MRLIDSDALLKKAIPKNSEARFRCVSVNDIINTPTIAQVERNEGHWIHEHFCSSSGGMYEADRCSECGWSEPLLMSKNFCPHCGAKMLKEG